MISLGYLKIDYDGTEVDNKIKGVNKTKEAYFLHVFPFYCAPKLVSQYYTFLDRSVPPV